jgi:hypothetical protein
LVFSNNTLGCNDQSADKEKKRERETFFITLHALYLKREREEKEPRM